MGLAGLSQFSPLSTLGTGSSRRTSTGESLSREDRYGYSEERAYDIFIQSKINLCIAVYTLAASKRRVRQGKTCNRNRAWWHLFIFELHFLLNVSRCPNLRSQGTIQVHQARFRLHVSRCPNLRLLAAKGLYTNKLLPSSAYIVRVPVLVLGTLK